MQSVPQIINELGGVTSVAAFLNVPLGTVSAWNTRKTSPSEHWAGIVQRGRDLGKPEITFEALAKIAAQKPRPTDAQPAGEAA
jgi:hypothetical protein